MAKCGILAGGATLLIITGLLLFTSLIDAQDTNSVPADKSHYTLFNPTPENLMRELSPDRPDATESPYTVDAGHFQLEMDFANFTYQRMDGTTTKTWNIAPINLKAGLCNRVDLQFIFDNYVNVRTRDSSGATTRQSGNGDFTTRLKINLWGNDGGQTAFGLLPYVKFPTSSAQLGNNAVEGGVILPLAIKLPHEFGIGCETAVGWWRNSADIGYHEEFLNSVTVDHQLCGKLSGYLEFFSDITTERRTSWIGTIDVGLEYLVTENIQFDVGCNFGITRAADDFHPFAGITVRF